MMPKPLLYALCVVVVALGGATTALLVAGNMAAAAVAFGTVTTVVAWLTRSPLETTPPDSEA